MTRFTATIYKIGINPVVDPPDEVLNAIFDVARRSKGPIPVCGKLNGSGFMQTLVKFRGVWRLYVNGPMLKSSGLKIGDLAEVELEFDPRPRDVRMPTSFATALASDRDARSAFDALPPSRQKEILRYLGALKTPAALEKNVARVMSQLQSLTTKK